MKRLLLIALLWMYGGLAQAAAPGDEIAIQSLFEVFRIGLGDTDGRVVCRNLGPESRALLDEARRAALTAPKAELQQRPLALTVLVLRARQELKAKELAAMNGSGFCQWAATRDGFFHRPTLAKLELDDLAIGEDAAEAKIYVPITLGQGGRTVTPRIGLPLTFAKEKGQWRVEIASLVPMGSRALDVIRVASGQPPDQFPLTLVESATKQPASPALWNPLQGRK